MRITVFIRNMNKFYKKQRSMINTSLCSIKLKLIEYSYLNKRKEVKKLQVFKIIQKSMPAQKFNIIKINQAVLQIRQKIATAIKKYQLIIK